MRYEENCLKPTVDNPHEHFRSVLREQNQTKALFENVGCRLQSWIDGLSLHTIKSRKFVRYVPLFTMNVEISFCVIELNSAKQN